ncbi:hypothetical protein FE257_001353 [Aspergillus nanangensis]|uniref:Calcineurin-like phosphoesterase domain-containing protein n=1 Tax=Aspergillus nanangensis TaxID=2582783 RepID=A0AAD4CDW0_ASPNN|nr:hypothetical protein FE257_001353 [Aspergillus nanangensis]
MVSIQVVADLHLETPAAYDVIDIDPQAPYLALLGDIGNVKDAGFFSFITAQLSKFKIVFFLLGNHEPYHSSWPKVKGEIEDFVRDINVRRAHDESLSLGELVFLDQTRYDLDPEVTLLGCTLFSNVTKDQEERVSFGLNDFYYIQDWTVEAHREAHAADLTWLNEQVTELAQSEPNRRIIIFSHYSPTVALQATDPRHINSPITSGFATDLVGEACWESCQVRLWAFGHTHYNCDYLDEATGKRVMANQRGYYFAQAEGFDMKKVVEL